MSKLQLVWQLFYQQLLTIKSLFFPLCCFKFFIILGSNLKALLQAFKGLQQAFSEAKNSDGTDTCGTDLYVLCAEAAYKVFD